jgi:hypothetical protein
MIPGQSPELPAIGTGSSAVAVRVTSQRWLGRLLGGIGHFRAMNTTRFLSPAFAINYHYNDALLLL